jgi:hypothetical protein
MQLRFAKPEDAELLDPLNAQLIRDEGHHGRCRQVNAADVLMCLINDLAELQFYLLELGTKAFCIRRSGAYERCRS